MRRKIECNYYSATILVSSYFCRCQPVTNKPNMLPKLCCINIVFTPIDYKSKETIFLSTVFFGIETIYLSFANHRVQTIDRIVLICLLKLYDLEIIRSDYFVPSCFVAYTADHSGNFFLENA